MSKNCIRLLGMRFCGWHLDHRALKNKDQKWSIVRRKLFETFLKQWIEKKFKCFVAVISDLHFDRASRVNNEKYEEKCYDQWYVSILSNM